MNLLKNLLKLSSHRACRMNEDDDEYNWTDGYTCFYQKSTWYRIPVKEDVDPMSDYTYEGFMLWLEMDEILDRMRRLRDIRGRY